MCFDPVSLGLLAAGTAASVGGTMLSRKDQTDAQNRDMLARNKVLQDTLSKEQAFNTENANTMNSLVPRTGAAATDALAGTALANRNAAIDNTIGTPDAAPIAAETPDVVKNSVADKMLSAFRTATDMAKAKAKVGAYGDAMGQINNNISNTAGAIDLTNNKARGVAAMLPAQQDLAAYSVYKTPSMVGPALTSVGSLLAGLGGSGLATKALGGLTSAAAPAAAAYSAGPFNPTTGTFGHI